MLQKVKDVSSEYRGDATLYKTDGEVVVETDLESHKSEYWVVSSVTGSVGGGSFAALNSLSGHGMTNQVDETMVFESNADGEMENSSEVVCVKPADESEAVEKLEGLINE